MLEDPLIHLNNCSRYYGNNKGKIILAVFHKLWKYHAAYIRDIHNRKDDFSPSKPTNNAKFKIGQAVIVRNHACLTLEPKYLTDYRVLKILNESTLPVVTPNGKECKRNINDVMPCTTLELVENAWSSFLNSIKIYLPSHEYSLRLCD